MAKYLQDIYFHSPEPPANFTKAEKEDFYAANKPLWAIFKLIEDLYNYNFPVKYSTPDNLWRMFIHATTDPAIDLSQPGFENWFYLDLEYLKSLDITDRKIFLFKKIAVQITAFCKSSGYSFTEFENTHNIIAAKNILFDEPYKKEKTSLDRKHKAVLWIKHDEFEEATYIKIVNKQGNVVLFQKISNLHFSNFDRIRWQDNETVIAYKRNGYAAYKQTEDYYTISLGGGPIKFCPQTKEEICYYGVELMHDPQTFNKGLEYIHKAGEMGHGKAKNILLNLEIDPAERNVDLLLQQPGKKNKLNTIPTIKKDDPK